MQIIKNIGQKLFRKIPILKNIYNKIRVLILKIRRIPKEYQEYKYYKKKIKETCSKEKVIYYLGIPQHVNLGDLAQGYCIRQWIKKYFSEYEVCEIGTDALVNTSFSVLKVLRDSFKKSDFIIFQSGYTTTDLGGYADLMHRKVIKFLPNAKMLMMPQTVYFQKEKNKKRSASVINSVKDSMIFLARDRISYNTALEMLPDIQVDLYPDIVTTLIGTMKFNHIREGILFCCRDDEEQYYSSDEMDNLIKKMSLLYKIKKTDTSLKGNPRDIILNADKYILNEIDKYSHFKVIITDRYHGTIFSLVSNTPVIVLKTTDHKVVTGLEWFKGVYDGYFYYAESLDEAQKIASDIYDKKFTYQLKPYFDKQYYSKLPSKLLEM